MLTQQIGKTALIAPQRVACRSITRPAMPLRTSRGACQQHIHRCSNLLAGQRVRAAAPEDVGTLGLGVAAAGLLFNPIVLWSEYTKFTTGAGLPEGPYGLLGAAEGIGYLVVLGIVGWSVR